MVITAAPSWFFTSTPPSCETVAVAIDAVAMANRTIPSSCLSLISFVSPCGGRYSARQRAALLELTKHLPAAQKISPYVLQRFVLLPLGSALIALLFDLSRPVSLA